METTSLLSLPYIMASQAQKHITHNEALRALDAIIHIGVSSRSAIAPPSEPADGARHIPGSGATDIWAGQDHKLAAFQDGAWAFYAPLTGWLAWVEDEQVLLVWDGTQWLEVIQDVNPVGLVGVNTTATETNRLAVKSDAVWFSHDDVALGSGDMRLTLNKADTVNTASLVFQNGYSGRAEFGLTGDDYWRVKVSADGTTWQDVLNIDNISGNMGIGTSVPLGPLHISGQDSGLVLENTEHLGNPWSIAIGRPGMFEDHLIIAAGADVTNQAAHQLRIPKDGRPVFSNGISLSDGTRIGSETSNGTAHYEPFDGTRGQLSFRGPIDSGDAELRIYGYYHDGAFTRIDVASFEAVADGGRLGVNTHAPTTTLHVAGPTRVGDFTVATIPDASTTGAGSIIFVSDEAGGPVLAFSDGTDWLRVTDRAVIS